MSNQDRIIDKNSVILFAANWTGGSSLFRLVQELCEGEYHVSNPELLAWSRGKDLNSAGKIVPYTLHRAVYLFRNIKPFKMFIENNRIEKGRHKLLIQVRDPADLLVAGYYGNTLSHAAQPGQQKKWNKKRIQMIREGVDHYVLRKAEKLNEHFEWLHILSDEHPKGLFQEEILSYHMFIYRFEEYVRNLVKLLDLEIDDAELLRIIKTHDALSFLRNANKRGFATNLNRMKRPEEWPFPGRAKKILEETTLHKLETMTPVFQSIYPDSVEKEEIEMEPPAAAISKNRFRLWLRYLFQIRLNEMILNLFRRFR